MEYIHMWKGNNTATGWFLPLAIYVPDSTRQCPPRYEGLEVFRLTEWDRTVT